MKQRKNSMLLTMLIAFLLFTGPTFIFAKAQGESRIAKVLVEGKEATEIYNLLAEQISDWLQDDDFILTSEYERITLPRDIVEFDIQGTIDEFEQATKRSFFSFFKKQQAVEMPLNVLLKGNHPEIEKLKSLDYIDHQQILKQVLQLAEVLTYDTIAIPYIDEANLPFSEIASNELTVPKTLSFATVKNFAKDLDQTLIEPQNIFSFLQAIDMPKSLKKANEELSFVATTLYEAVLQTDLNIIKRHHHLQVPQYTEAGLDVLIHKGENKDFVLQNDSPLAYEIHTSIKDRTLTISLHSLEQDFSYTYEKENETTISPRTIYRYSKDLNPGETEVLQSGEEGLSIDIYRTIYGADDELLRTDLITKDVYLPKPTIILTSTEEEAEATDSSSSSDPEQIEEELDEIEESVTEFNRWLTGSADSDLETDETKDLATDLRPFFYIFPANFTSLITGKDDAFTERFEQLEEMIENNVKLTDEVVLDRLIELEARLESIKQQYEELAEVLETHDLLQKGDE